MADYKELLRRAISALPENNGAARRAVYEKARSALVGQLRAITPPLLARDITQHRLQLEDCIRQVEQEASEAVINLGREMAAAARPTVTASPRPSPPPPPPPPKPEPVVVARPEPEPKPEPKPEPIVAKAPEPVKPKPAEPVFVAPQEKPEPIAPVVAEPVPEPTKPAEPETAHAPSIEDIIAAAAATSGVEVTPAIPGRTSDPFTPESAAPVENKPSFFATRREPSIAPAANSTIISVASALPAARVEPSLGATALARQPATEPVIIANAPVDTALSSVREVDLEEESAREAEGAIERAIETLDREARGEPTAPLPDPEPALKSSLPFDSDLGRTEDNGFATAEAEPRSGAGLTIFLVVFALLLVGVGGAGYWAWREEYLDFDQMFGRAEPVTEVAAPQVDPAFPTLNTNSSDEGAAGPGNTSTTTTSEPTTALEGLEIEERLEPTPVPVQPTGSESMLPDIGANTEIKTEERLSNEDTSIAAADPAASVDPVNLAGNQSLLLEASADGQSGAVPFSGTVDWSEGVDEIGLPTLVAKASIPARNLSVDITIRKNSDPILPASHLMEITFNVPDTFIGGTIATLAGVLLKDQELVPGTALEGAAARVVGNSFLFALSASADHVASNTTLLDERRWIDLAIVYGTGRNAILTLEKDESAQGLFDKALAAWAQ